MELAKPKKKKSIEEEEVNIALKEGVSPIIKNTIMDKKIAEKRLADAILYESEQNPQIKDAIIKGSKSLQKRMIQAEKEAEKEKKKKQQEEEIDYIDSITVAPKPLKKETSKQTTPPEQLKKETNKSEETDKSPAVKIIGAVVITALIISIIVVSNK